MDRRREAYRLSSLDTSMAAVFPGESGGEEAAAAATEEAAPDTPSTPSSSSTEFPTSFVDPAP